MKFSRELLVIGCAALLLVAVPWIAAAQSGLAAQQAAAQAAAAKAKAAQQAAAEAAAAKAKTTQQAAAAQGLQGPSGHGEQAKPAQQAAGHPAAAQSKAAPPATAADQAMQQAVKAQAAIVKSVAAQLKAQEQQLESAITDTPDYKRASQLALIDRTREQARKLQAKSDEAAFTIQLLKAQNVPASDYRMKEAIALRDAQADTASAMRSIADATVSAMLSGTDEQLGRLSSFDRAREQARKLQAKSDEAAFTIQLLQAQSVPASDNRMKAAVALRDAQADAASAMRSTADAMVSALLSETDGQLNEQLKQLASIDRMREQARKVQAKSDEAARTIEVLKSQDVPASDDRMKAAIAQRDSWSDSASAMRSTADALANVMVSNSIDKTKMDELNAVRAAVDKLKSATANWAGSE